MKQYLKASLIIMLFVSVNLFAQTPDTLWTKTYGGVSNEAGTSLQQSSDGGYIIAGYTGYPDDVWLLKTDAYGDTLWTKTYGGANREWGNSVQQTSDGGYIIAGMTESYGAGSKDVYLIKTDANGDTLWTKTYGGASDDLGYSVEQASDEGYIITGETKSFGAGWSDLYLIKTDTNGDTLWTKTYGGTIFDAGNSVQQTTDSGYIIAGFTTSFGAGGYDVWLLKTDANGDTLWTKTYGGTINDAGNSVRQTSDEGYLIAGMTESYGAGNEDVYLIKTDANGDTLWTKTYGGVHHERGFAVQQTTDSGYIIAGFTTSFGAGGYDVWLLKTDANGDTLWTRTYGDTAIDVGNSVQQTMDGGYSVVGVTTSYSEIKGNLYFIRLTPDSLLTDDSLSLAYNGNRHFVRQPNTVTLHLVYVMEGHILYTRSTDGGNSWGALKNLGKGESPAICLDIDWNPCVTWTSQGELNYSRKNPIWGWTHTIYSWAQSTPSHPAIAVTPSSVEPYPDTVHIVFRFLDNVSSSNEIKEISFAVSNPQSYRTRTLDEKLVVGTNTLDFPSVARDFNNTLHAVWMHVDTVWYGTRAEAQANWYVWGWQFDSSGVQSDHPFVETYGDSIFVVWQRESDEDIYRSARHIGVSPPAFVWVNFSQTSATPSLYSVNASGMITTIVDKASTGDEYDIFWDTGSGGSLHNLSSTRRTRSIFPHTSLQITVDPPVQYTIWQEGNEIPYEIKLEKTLTGRDFPSISAYFNSIAGFEIPSLYLVERDSFISNWQIPVDMGYDTLKYAFHLVPPYLYKVKIVAYHESQGQLVTRVTLDDTISTLIQYNVWQPETLEMWVPQALYMDSLVEAEFEFVSGGLAIGPIYIYRYENITGTKLLGGPQSIGAEPFISWELNICNIFKDDAKIDFTLPFDQKTKLCLYDVTGRLMRKMDVSKRVLLTTSNLPSGVYFLKIGNPMTGGTMCWKFLKVK